jgi:hypothetical protein
MRAAFLFLIGLMVLSSLPAHAAPFQCDNPLDSLTTTMEVYGDATCPSGVGADTGGAWPELCVSNSSAQQFPGAFYTENVTVCQHVDYEASPHEYVIDSVKNTVQLTWPSSTTCYYPYPSRDDFDDLAAAITLPLAPVGNVWGQKSYQLDSFVMDVADTGSNSDLEISASRDTGFQPRVTCARVQINRDISVQFNIALGINGVTNTVTPLAAMINVAYTNGQLTTAKGGTTPTDAGSSLLQFSSQPAGNIIPIKNLDGSTSTLSYRVYRESIGDQIVIYMELISGSRKKFVTAYFQAQP